MTRPILRFIDTAREHVDRPLADSTIPINAAIVFFEDKKLNDIKERLEAERDGNSITEVSLRQLANVIEKVRTGNDAAEAVFPEDHPEEQPSSAPPEDVKPEVEAPPEKPKPPVKIFSDFEEDLPVITPEDDADSEDSRRADCNGRVRRSARQPPISLLSF